jgi:LPXTG-motif cell wall-anchored protein
MTNKIVLNPTIVPALDGKTVAVLAALLLIAGVGAILWQRRKRTTTLAG